MLPSGTWGAVPAAGTIGPVGPSVPSSLPPSERITTMARHPDAAQPANGDLARPAAAPATTSAAGATPRDYYDEGWGTYISGQRVDEREERWFRYLPLMRVYGFVVLAVALVVAYPRDDAGGWRGPLAVAGIAALAVVFGIMWVRRPIWGYSTRILAAHGGASQRELGELLHLAAPTVTSMLKRMERHGTITRQPDPQDQRMTRVRLTPAGLQTEAKLRGILAAQIGRLLDPMPGDDRRELARLLDELAERMTTALDEPVAAPATEGGTR